MVLAVEARMSLSVMMPVPYIWRRRNPAKPPPAVYVPLRRRQASYIPSGPAAIAAISGGATPRPCRRRIKSGELV